MSVLKRLSMGLAGVALFFISAFFLWVISYIVSSEIMPALRNGSLNVESETMILNIVWEGNEIYILLAAYLLLAAACGYGAYRLIRNAVRKSL